jgi:hypothetical protein
MSKAAISELNSEELDHVNGGEVTVTVEKGYVGIEVSIGGYGIAVWATGGSICGQVKTPNGIHSGCTP